MKSQLSGLTISVLAVCVLWSIPPTTDAAMKMITTTVQSILITSDTQYGGCMARLAVSPRSILPTCGSEWVTFSCSGDFTDVARAYRLLDQAQLAYTLKKKVLVVVDDARKHNGYCFASRIDLQ